MLELYISHVIFTSFILGLNHKYIFVRLIFKLCYSEKIKFKSFSLEFKVREESVGHLPTLNNYSIFLYFDSDMNNGYKIYIINLITAILTKLN